MTIGIDAVERLLRSTPPTSLPIRFSDIIEITAKRAGIHVHELKGSSRTATVVFWRSVCSYLGRKLTSLSYPELASAIGRKNHSTVHAAVKRIDNLLHQTETTTTINNETVDIKEIVDQLSWTIRTKAND
jgi:chromosomal replication initiator protein